jgi:hypothetical protein
MVCNAGRDPDDGCIAGVVCAAKKFGTAAGAAFFEGALDCSVALASDVVNVGNVGKNDGTGGRGLTLNLFSVAVDKDNGFVSSTGFDAPIAVVETEKSGGMLVVVGGCIWGFSTLNTCGLAFSRSWIFWADSVGTLTGSEGGTTRRVGMADAPPFTCVSLTSEIAAAGFAFT